MNRFDTKVFNLDSFYSIYEENKDKEMIMSAFLRLSDDEYRRTGNVNVNGEINDLYVLIDTIKDNLNTAQKSGYFFSYKILDKISEEFDLLRFSNESILNIEVKKRVPDGGDSEIEEQLRRHKFVLSVLDKTVLPYAFVCDEKNSIKLMITMNL